MLKKAGLLTIGITAGLLAVAPIASAGEYEGDHSDRDSSHDKDWDGDHDGDHDDDGDHGKSKHHNENDGDDDFAASCDFTGGDAGAGAETGDAGLAGNVVTQAPVAGNNIGNLGNCSSFLNDNFSGNDIAVSVLGGSSIVP